MTRLVVILLVLYVVWRVASILGRRREREVRASQQGRGGGVVLPMARCRKCGRYLSAGEIRWEGHWPNRHAVCANGCRPDGDDDEPAS